MSSTAVTPSVWAAAPAPWNRGREKSRISAASKQLRISRSRMFFRRDRDSRDTAAWRRSSRELKARGRGLGRVSQWISIGADTSGNPQRNAG